MQRDDVIKRFEDEENAKVVQWMRNFCQDASGTSFTLLALLAVGFAASVLKDGGFRMHKPIAIVLPNDEAVDVIGNMLPIFPKRILSTNISEKTLHNQIRCGRDDIFPFIFQKGDNTGRTLNILRTAAMSGYDEQTLFDAVAVVLFTGVLPVEERKVFSVIIEATSQKQIHALTWQGKASMTCLLKTFLATRWRSCMKKIWRNLKEMPDTSSDFRTLLAAGLMLEEALQWADADAKMLKDYHDKMVSSIMRTEEMTDAYGESDAMARIFIGLLRSEVGEGHVKLTMLSDLQGTVTGGKTLSEDILSDEKFYYLSDSMFRNVCREMPFASQASVKQALAETGVLCTEGQGRIYMTKKLKVEGFAGGKRFIWLKKSAIDTAGKLALSELGEKDGQI